MSWDFATEPEFEAKLQWMRTFVRENVWPLETLAGELGWEGLRRAAGPLQEEVKEQGLWAAHLDPELGGQGFGQVKLGLMHEILGSSPIAPIDVRQRGAGLRAARESSRSPVARPSRRSAGCTRCWPAT